MHPIVRQALTIGFPLRHSHVVNTQALARPGKRVALKIVHGVGGTLDACKVGNPKTPDKIPVLTDLDPVKAKLTREKLFEFFLYGLAVVGSGAKIANVEGFVGRDWGWIGVEGSDAVRRERRFDRVAGERGVRAKGHGDHSGEMTNER